MEDNQMSREWNVCLKPSKDAAAILFYLDRETMEQDEREAHNFYWIEIDDLASSAGLAQWLDHMREKVWFDMSVELEFLRMAYGMTLDHMGKAA